MLSLYLIVIQTSVYKYLFFRSFLIDQSIKFKIEPRHILNINSNQEILIRFI